jgi:HEAT repeat protein
MELRRLAGDANWEVREWAGSAAGDVFGTHFGELYPVMEDWLRDNSQFVRRAVAIALMGASDRKHPERAEPLLALADTLVRDPAEEVKRNTGPFAVGNALLGKYPAETLEHVRGWARSDEQIVRWNAAMVFVSANARKHVAAGLEILSALATDKRRPVWMAVSSAAKNLAKRDPERTLPELRRWLLDERKLPASLALRHVTIKEQA